MKSLKIVLGRDIRKLVCPPHTLTELVEAIAKAFHTRAFALKYLDDENDLVCLENDRDFEDMCQSHRTRVYVMLKRQTPHKCRMRWHGVTCSACCTTPICGNLHVCTVCPDYRLCEDCETQKPHVHPLLVHKKPAHASFALPTPKLKMRFVEHCNWKAREVFQPMETARKVWKIMNSGDAPWPEGCCLGPAKGDLKGPGTCVPPLRPKEECEVISVVHLPGIEGKHNGVWRLFSPTGVPFGDKLYLVAQVQQNTEQFKKKLEALTTMGFSREDSLKTLGECQCNVERALERLCNNQS